MDLPDEYVRIKLLDDSNEISVSELTITTNPTTPYYNPNPDHMLNMAGTMEVQEPDLILTDPTVEDEFLELIITPMEEQYDTEQQTSDSAIPIAPAAPATQLSEEVLAIVRGLAVSS